MMVTTCGVLVDFSTVTPRGLRGSTGFLGGAASWANAPAKQNNTASKVRTRNNLFTDIFVPFSGPLPNIFWCKRIRVPQHALRSEADNGYGYRARISASVVERDFER